MIPAARLCLTNILLQGIHKWFDMQTQLSPYDFPISYRLLISQQNKIGWRQLFHGRFATEWSRLHDDYTFHSQKQQQDGVYQRQLKGTRKRTGNQWCQDIASVLWSQWFVVWTSRNEVIHGRNATERRQKQDEENLRRLRKTYSQRELMEPSVQELLFEHLQDHEALPPHSIRNWLAVHEPIFLQSIKQVSSRAIQGVRNIKSYFQPQSQVPSHTDAEILQPSTIIP
jgi:hypothetical protein